MSKRKKSKVGIILLTGFFIYCSYIVIEQQRILNARNSEMISIQKQIEEEEKQNKELKKQREMINSDEYVESIAREKLGMIKKSEKIFVDHNK